jgi:hypothetical protein
MLLTATIESFLDPEVGLVSAARPSLVLTLFLAGMIVGGLEVASDLFARLRLGGRTGVGLRMHGIGLIIAIICVLISRLLRFRPGYLYGTVGALYLVPDLVGAVRSGKRALMVLGAVFVGGLSLWACSALLPPGLVELEVLFLTVFLVALQGVSLQLFPLAITEGGKLFRWDRRMWLVCFLLVLFPFNHFVLNPNGSDVEALRQNGVIILLLLVAGYGLATLALYLLFPFRLKKKMATGGDSAVKG